MNKVITTAIATILLGGCAVSPEPFTQTQLEQFRDDRLSQLTQDQEVIAAPVSLYEAMARAIKYNLDYKVELMEEALQSSEFDLANLDMLPQLVANAGYSNRSNYSGSRSSALLGANSVGPESLVPSTSSEKDVIAADLTASWDILDFGLSYVRAKQQGDRLLVSNERRRKVAIRVIEDVRTAYWRAISAERLISRLGELEADAANALEQSRKVYLRRKVAPMAALNYQRELLQIKRQIQDLQNELVVSKQQLGALMNVDPSQDFELVMPDREAPLDQFRIDPEKMVNIAMIYRPEIREASYEQRINEREAKAALLELLPSLRFYGGFNHNSNDYLYSNNWTSWGAQTSWNVFELFRYPARTRSVEAQKNLLEQRALALTMAVMTQVHVSATRYEIARRKLETAREYYDVQGKILDQTIAGYKSRKVSEQNYIREQMNEILSEVKYDLAHAELQNAFANVHASIGMDPYGSAMARDVSVQELATELENHWLNHNGGLTATR